MKISKKLPLLIILISAIPILLVAIIAYPLISNSSMDTYKDILNTTTSSVTLQFDDFFKSQISNLKYSSKLDAYKNLMEHTTNATYYKDAQKSLDVSVNTDSNLNNTLLIDLNGNVIATLNGRYEGHNVADAGFFEDLKDKPLTDGVYIGLQEDEKNKYIAMSTYVTNEGEKIGVICNIVNLDYINSNVKNIGIGKTGFIFVLDNTGSVLSHHYQERVGALNADNENIKPLYNMAQSFAKGTLDTYAGYLSYSREGEALTARYEKTSIADLIIISAISTAEIYEQAYKIGFLIILIALITIIISLIVGLRVAYKFIASLNYVTLKIATLAQGNLKERCNYKGHDEFLMLCDNINIMAKNLDETHDQLIQLATIDILTNLNNRKAIYDIIDNNYIYEKQAMLLMDLNGFKSINDNLGHDYGDIALKKVAGVLLKAENNNTFVARLGGDEFLVFVKYYEHEQEVFSFATAIYDRVAEITMLEDKPVNLSISIGIAFKRIEDTTKSSLIKKADVAMYEIKNAKDGNKYAVYDKD